MRRGVQLAIVLWAVALCSLGSDEQAIARGDSDRAAQDTSRARSFLNALLAKNETRLYSYTNSGAGFFEGKHLAKEISDFLYGDHEGWKSVTRIAESGPLESVIVPQGNHVVIVLYVPAANRKDIGGAHFLKSQWMKKYFACQFDISNQQWKLVANFCFAETDGPYPEDAG
jgi:hypothetical protein